MAKASELTSCRPFHPGELLKDELSYRNIKQKDLAQRMGLSYTALNEVLNGRRSLSTELALMLEAYLGVSADLLMRMQTDYNLQISRSNANLLARLAELRKYAAAF